MRQSRNILSGYLDDGDVRMRKEELCNLAKKIIVFLFSVLVLSVLVFFIARLAPGDPLVSYYGDRVEKDLDKFKAECDVILANRAAPELADVAGKVYTRDLYSRD